MIGAKYKYSMCTERLSLIRFSLFLLSLCDFSVWHRTFSDLAHCIMSCKSAGCLLCTHKYCCSEWKRTWLWDWCDRLQSLTRPSLLSFFTPFPGLSRRSDPGHQTLKEFSPNGLILYSDIPVVFIKFLIFAIKKWGYKMSVKLSFRSCITYLYTHRIDS